MIEPPWGGPCPQESFDRELADGKCRGPLHGIPIGIKDLIDVAGWPTLVGAPWLPHAPAATDAPLVARLRDAGVIILGKTVTTQFACFDPPPTRNPWDLDRTPGGSSSGSAAAVATGMCLGAVGSQTGGSITRPASFCGVAGCKPTYGIVPIEGVYPLSPSLDHPGPIARSVHDLAILFEAITGKPVAMDRSTKSAADLMRSFVGTEAAFKPNVRNIFIAEDGAKSSANPPRLGRLRGLFVDRAEPASLAVFETALARLSQAGARISEGRLPPAFDNVLALSSGYNDGRNGRAAWNACSPSIQLATSPASAASLKKDTAGSAPSEACAGEATSIRPGPRNESRV